MSEQGEVESSPPRVPICVVVPCYNEEKRIDVDRFRDFLIGPESPYLLFVDDGSSDQTRHVLANICQTNPQRASLLVCEKNSGKAEAVRLGIVYALDHFHPAIVGFWDADLATPLYSIASFVEIFQNDPRIQMVFGARVKLLGRHVERRAVRHYLGRIFATVVSTVLSLPIYDTQCGAKLFRADETARQAFASPFLSKWIFDVEIIARYLKATGYDRRRLEQAIYEYPLESWVDIAGSKLRPKDFFQSFWDVFRIWRSYL